MKPLSFRIPSPDLQIDFSIALAHIRQEYLQEALCETILNMDIAELDRELAAIVPRKESPSTNRFYRISHIASGEGEEFNDFRNRIVALTGIPN